MDNNNGFHEKPIAHKSSILKINAILAEINFYRKAYSWEDFLLEIQAKPAEMSFYSFKKF